MSNPLSVVSYVINVVKETVFGKADNDNGYFMTIVGSVSVIALILLCLGGITIYIFYQYDRHDDTSTDDTTKVEPTKDEDQSKKAPIVKSSAFGSGYEMSDILLDSTNDIQQRVNNLRQQHSAQIGF